jgi:low temperature requirement protein LtrA
MERDKVNIWWGPPKKFTSLIEERKISWLELFYDLVYVIAISRITHHFAAHPDLSGLASYAFLFIMIFWGWVNGSLYHDLHGSPGIRTRFMTLWQMLIVAALIVCIESPPGLMVFRITIELCVLQIFITYLWWSVGIYDKEHRIYNRPYTMCFLLSTMLLISSLFIEPGFRKVIVWTALVLNYLPPFLVLSVLKRRNADFSLSPNMVERLGLFTIIVFGECVLGVINSATNLVELNFTSWLNFSLGILIVFELWWIFFSVIADTKSRKGFLFASLIEIAYIPTVASLGIIGASFPGLVQTFNSVEIGTGIKNYFCGALGIFLIGVVALSYLLQYPKEFEHAKRMLRALMTISAFLIFVTSLLSHFFTLTIFLAIVFGMLMLIIITITRVWFVVQLRMIEGSK